MIKSFANKLTENVWNAEHTRLDQKVTARALRKLNQIDAAVELDDLRTPPGNKLKALTGKRAGQHSIRINRQWRICFNWEPDGVHDVAIVDYH